MSSPHPNLATPDTFVKFDYVIVGGGTSGLACAARLADGDPKITVGVLEAGGWLKDDPVVDVPSLMGRSIMDPTYDWCLKSTVQTDAGNREWILPRGKMLGGSSAMNFLCWQRGYRNDFDDIAKLGNPGWDWDSLSKTYSELTKTSTASSMTEIQKQNGCHVDAECHGNGGPLDLTHAHWYCDAQKSWWNMLLQNGLEHVPDGSGSGQTHGVWNTLVTVCPKTSKRVHAGTAFAEKPRNNLQILTNAHVCRLNLEPSGHRAGLQRAVGVTYEHQGKQYEVRARREVILAAGTFLSPQLLELSGIGDKAILEKVGIPVKVANANVGRNLQEHLFISSVHEVNCDTLTFDKLKDGEFAQKAMAFMGEDRQSDTTGGILGSAVVTAFGYSSLKGFMTPEEIASLNKMAKATDMRDWTEGMKKGHELQMSKLFHDRGPAMEYALLPAYFSTDGAPKDATGYLSPLVLLQYPLSRGTVHICSDDPTKPPAIDPKYFSNKVDLRVMAHALQQSVARTEKDPELAKVIVARHSPSQDVKTIEQWEDYLREHSGTTYHPVGTCSMMPEQMGGVVDSKLRVYGTENVRVADASVMPLMPSGHIQSACYVIGFKAADMILARA